MIDFVSENSAYPDKTPLNAVFELGLHYLPEKNGLKRISFVVSVAHISLCFVVQYFVSF